MGAKRRKDQKPPEATNKVAQPFIQAPECKTCGMEMYRMASAPRFEWECTSPECPSQGKPVLAGIINII